MRLEGWGQACFIVLCCVVCVLQGRLEWESDSGRQITIGDVSVNELSKVEVQALQRLAITILQSMDIPVSHGLLKGADSFPCRHGHV